MKFLVDTHAILWYFEANNKLAPEAQKLLQNSKDSENELLDRVVSIWEIAIKIQVGKLNLKFDFPDAMYKELKRMRIEVLPIEEKHVTNLLTLPMHHRDPFDRMLASRAASENMKLLSSDSIFDEYAVERYWK